MQPIGVRRMDLITNRWVGYLKECAVLNIHVTPLRGWTCGSPKV